MLAGKVAVGVELIYLYRSVTDTQGPSEAFDQVVGRFHHTEHIGADRALRVVLYETNPMLRCLFGAGLRWRDGNKPSGRRESCL